MKSQKIDFLKNALFSVLFLICWGNNAEAFDFQLNGFADLVGTQSSTSLPLDNIGNQGTRLTFDPESRLGLNLGADLGANLTFSSQVLAQGNAGGEYNLAAAWLFATYRPFEWLAIRAGKQINPVFLYSEQINVGYTYLWTRLPSEVYGLYPLQSFNGLSVIHTLFFGDYQLRTQLIGGAGSETITQPSLTFTGTSNEVKGIESTFSSDHFKARIGYIASNPTGSVILSAPLAQTPQGILSGLLTSPVDIGTVQNISAGTSFDFMNFVGSAEIDRLLGSGTLIRATTGVYGSLGYRVLPKLITYFVYAWENLNGTVYYYPDTTVSTTPKIGQHSTIIGLNFRMTPSAVLKAEYMRRQESFADSIQNFGANTYTLTADLVF